jgi:RecA-family ATPase
MNSDALDTLSRIYAALPPSVLNYEEWLQIGMAAKAEGGSCSDWDAWSRHDMERYHEGECDRKWRGFGRSGGKEVRIGTAVEIARSHGFDPAERHSRPEGPVTAYDWDDELPAIGGKTAGPVVRPEYITPVDLPSPTDDWNPSKEMLDYLVAIFKPGEQVSLGKKVFQAEDGRWKPVNRGDLFPVDYLTERLAKGRDVSDVIGDYNHEGGVFVRINPMLDDGGSDKSVAAWRHALIECDDRSPEEQYAMILKLELPCAAVIFSGSKSVHAIVKVDARTEEEYRKKVDYLFKTCKENGIPLDKQNRNPSRYSRLPGVDRGKGRQRLLKTDCGKATWQEWVDFIEESKDDLPDIEAADAFIDNPPPLADEIIGGVLRKGHKMLLSGPSKAGKSYLLMELAMAVAEGREWLGWKCAEGRALYINLELDASSCKNRLHDLYAAKGWKYSRGRLDIWNLRGRSEPLGKLCDKLIRRSRDKGYTIIIIDPIYKVITGDENDAASMAAFCNFFDRIAAGTGAAVAYCHHHSKGEQGMKKAQDRASGSGVFARDPDALIDMIALPLDEGRRKAVTDRLACDALYVELDRLKPNWRTIISQDDALIPSKIAEWFSKEPGFNEAFDRAMAAAESATGWRIDGILREFPGFKPKDIWFRWPCHEADTTGMLKDVLSEGEENIRRRKGPTKKEKLEAMGAEFSLIFDTLAARGGDVTAQAMAEDMRVSVKEIYSMAQKLKTFMIKDSIVRRKE